MSARLRIGFSSNLLNAGLPQKIETKPTVDKSSMDNLSSAYINSSLENPSSAYIKSSFVPDLVDLLKTATLFPISGKDDYVNEICDLVHFRFYREGNVVIKEGEIAKAMFFIVKGAVAIISEDMEENFLEIHAPGYFGEIGALLRIPRTATVRALKKTVVAVLMADDIDSRIIKKYPDFSATMFQEANSRLEALNGAIESFSMKSEHQLERFVEMRKDSSSGSFELKTYSRRGSQIFLSNSSSSLSDLTTKRSPIAISPEEQTASKKQSTGKFGSQKDLMATPQLYSESNLFSVQSPLNESFSSTLILDPVETEDVDSSIAKLLDRSLPPTKNEVETSSNPNAYNTAKQQVLKHGGMMGQRRASVAVWSDNKLMQILRNVESNSSASSGSKSKRLVNSALAKGEFSNSEDDNLSVNCSEPDMELMDETDTREFGKLSQSVMWRILSKLEFKEVFRMRILNSQFSKLIFNEFFINQKSAPIARSLVGIIDLSLHHKKVNDNVLSIISRTGGTLINFLSLKDCWSITDQGLKILSSNIPNLTTINLSSCWETTDSGLTTLAKQCPKLKSINLSNCRKLTNTGILTLLENCPLLISLELSYCKNLTEKMFDHENWSNFTKLNLQRCTAISDQAFHRWTMIAGSKESSIDELDGKQVFSPPLSPVRVSLTSLSNSQITFKMTELNLSDCSFLTGNAIRYLSLVCGQLKTLSLTFCCSLTEDSVDDIVSNLKEIEILDLSFCGNAVTDFSLDLISKGCPKLLKLGIRGCGQVTDKGVINLYENCQTLLVLNLSQCNMRKLEIIGLRTIVESRTRNFKLLTNNSGDDLLKS